MTFVKQKNKPDNINKGFFFKNLNDPQFARFHDVLNLCFIYCNFFN